MKGQTVTPFDVGTITSYEKLINEFGCTPITNDLFERFERMTGTKMPRQYRDYVISHREFDVVLDDFENKKPFYLYTGRGPSSSSMHLGHLLPFQFCSFLQSAFKVPLVIQITDDEKFLFKKGLTMDEIKIMTVENIRDIIACDFDRDLTFIFTNTSFVSDLYPMVLKLGNLIPTSKVQSTFGFAADTSVGKLGFPLMQCAPSFAESFTGLPMFSGKPKMRCVIPCAIDQDPYFRLCREFAGKVKHPKPAVIHTKFLPGLTGVNTKMSSSNTNECIFLCDTAKQIRKKINSAFSGGQELLEDHRRLGGNTDIDVPHTLLTYFCSDTNWIEHLRVSFREGNITCGEMKNTVADYIISIVTKFQKSRSAVTQDEYDHYLMRK